MFTHGQLGSGKRPTLQTSAKFGDFAKPYLR